jgi:hypothetical protein
MGTRGTLRVAFAFALLFASLSLVIRRQSGAMAVLRELDAVRSHRAVVEAERGAHVGRIEQLESRARITAVVGARWGMRVPAVEEQVIIELPGVEAAPKPRREAVLAGLSEARTEPDR